MFNYFIPNATKAQVAPSGDKLDHAYLRSLGLAETLADVELVPQHAAIADVQRGPSGVAGVVIAPVMKHRGPPSILYDGNLQRWESGKRGLYWIGFVKDRPSPIMPEDLERWETIGGADIRDDAGNSWFVPVGRAPHHGSPFGNLPQSYTLDPDTLDMKEHLAPAYTWLWNLTGAIRDWYLSQQELPDDATPEEKASHKPQPFSDLARLVAPLFGVNYRLGFVEINVLHKLGVALLTQRTVHLAARSSFGWEVLEQAKKNGTDSDSSPAVNSSPSTTGESIPAAAPGIGPAAAL